MKDKPSLPPDSRPQLPHLHSTNFSHRHDTPDFERSDIASNQDSIVFTPGSEPEPFPFHDFLNEEPTSNTPNLQAPGFHTDRTNPGPLQHQKPYSCSPQTFNSQNNCPSLATFTAGAEQSHSREQPLEFQRQIVQPSAQTPQHYNFQQLLSPSQRNTNPMQYPAYAPQCPLDQQGTSPNPSAYAPFQNHFQDSESARRFREQATRFDRTPYRPSDEDPSIYYVKQNRQHYVKRIYDAMTRSDAAKDNAHSIAMRRWVENPAYDSKLVESYAHRVLDCLIEQVEFGYRGWPHTDYVADDRKGEPEDKSVSCAERLENIISGLEQEKTICEDIMGSKCQIRMFVNAPRAYARRKEANRHGNSKRGKATAAKPEPGRQTRAKKARERQAARQRHSATPSYVPASTQLPLRELEPNFQNLNFGPQTPYFTTPASAPPHLQAVPQQHPGPPHHEAAFNGLSNYHSSPMSPAQPHANGAAFTAGTSSLPTGGFHSSHLSPPPISHGSLPTTPAVHGSPGIAFPGMQSHAGTHGSVSSSWPPWSGNSLSADQSGQPSLHDVFHHDQQSGAPALDNWSLMDFDPQQTEHSEHNAHGSSIQHGISNAGDQSGHGTGNDNGSMSVNPSALNIDPALHFVDFWNEQHNVQAFPGTNDQKPMT